MRSVLIMCVISLLWGSAWLLAPAVPAADAPYAVAALRFAVAGAAALLAAAMARNPPGAVSLPWRSSATLALLLLGAPTVLLLWAGRHGIGAAEPLLYALLPLMFAMATDSWPVLYLLPVWALLTLLRPALFFTAHLALWSLPVLLAVVLQVFALRYAARCLRAAPMRQLLLSLGLQCGLAALLLGVLSPLLDPPHDHNVWSLPAAAALLVLGTLGTALPYALLFGLLADGRLSLPQIAVTQWLQTLMAITEGAVLGHVRPTWSSMVAMLTVALCSALVLLHPDATGDMPLTLGDTRPHEPS